MIQHELGRYLVTNYPQWACEPYTLSDKFENPYENHQDDDKYKEINEKFKSNYQALKALIGEKDFDKKINAYGLYNGNKV